MASLNRTEKHEPGAELDGNDLMLTTLKGDAGFFILCFIGNLICHLVQNKKETGHIFRARRQSSVDVNGGDLDTDLLSGTKTRIFGVGNIFKEGKHLGPTAIYYLAFLRTGCYTMGTLTVISFPFFYFGDVGSCTTFTAMITVYVLVIVYGIIVLLFAYRLAVYAITTEKHIVESCSIWITNLPVNDRIDGELFHLTKKEIRQVETDIKSEVTKKIQTKLAELKGDCSEFRDEAKVIDAYVVPFWKSRAQQTTLACRMRLAGHVFVTVSRPAYANLLFHHELSKFWYLHNPSFSLLKFGRPPLSSMALKYCRAPPESDIMWSNLHLASYMDTQRSWGFSFLLIIVMLGMGAPISLANTLVGECRVFELQFPSLACDTSAYSIIGTIPTYLLLVVNSLIMPSLIEVACNARQEDLNSRSEFAQFSQNFYCLVFNSFVLPMSGLATGSKSIFTSVYKAWTRGHTHSAQVQQYFRDVSRFSHLPGTAIQKYLLSATFITSSTQLILLGNNFSKYCCACIMGDDAVPFAWGYWYAWAMSTFFVCLVTSIAIPTVLPIGLLFFVLTLWVHKHNLERQAYDSSREMHGKFNTMIVDMMIQCVGWFWMIMGAFFYFRSDFNEQTSRHTVSWFALCFDKAVKVDEDWGSSMAKLCIAIGSLFVLAMLQSKVLATGGNVDLYLRRKVGAKSAVYIVFFGQTAVLVAILTSVLFKFHLSDLYIEHRRSPLHKVLGITLLMLTCVLFVGKRVGRMFADAAIYRSLSHVTCASDIRTSPFFGSTADLASRALSESEDHSKLYRAKNVVAHRQGYEGLLVPHDDEEA